MNDIPHQTMPPMPQAPQLHSPVSQIVEDLNDALQENANLTTELRNRLQPVICETPQGTDDAQVPPPSSCAMVGRIADMIGHVRNTNRTLQSTLAELQL